MHIVRLMAAPLFWEPRYSHCCTNEYGAVVASVCDSMPTEDGYDPAETSMCESGDPADDPYGETADDRSRCDSPVATQSASQPMPSVHRIW